jgi:DNA-binding IclR family transcriptional regulator
VNTSNEAPRELNTLTKRATTRPVGPALQAEPLVQSADIRAVSRAAQILNLFSPTQPEIGVTSVAQQLSMNRTTAYRYCMSLAAAQLLERLDNGQFAPGKMLLQLGAFALGRRDILTAAPRHMHALSVATGATAVLSVWGSAGPVVAAVAEDPQHNERVTVWIGTHLTMDAAQTRVFYAFHPDQLYIQRLLANLPSADHDRLSAATHDVRQNGYASAVNPRGIAILAVPIFDHAGMCAALALISTRDALSTDANSSELNALKRTAAELSDEMGGTEPRANQKLRASS